MLLGHLGAEIIKIEPPGAMDIGYVDAPGRENGRL